MAKPMRIAGIAIVGCLVAQFTLAEHSRVELGKIKSSSVKYCKDTDLSIFPIPVVSFKRGGLASGSEELNEIMERIVYTIINESSDPISTMIVEYFPSLPGKVGVEVYWTNGAVRGALVDKGADGHYDSGAYKIFFKKPTP